MKIYRLSRREKIQTREALKWRPPLLDAKSPEMQEREQFEEKMLVENALREAARKGAVQP